MFKLQPSEFELVVEQVIRFIIDIVVDVSIFYTRIQTRYLHMHVERMWGDYILCFVLQASAGKTK